MPNLHQLITTMYDVFLHPLNLSQLVVADHVRLYTQTCDFLMGCCPPLVRLVFALHTLQCPNKEYTSYFCISKLLTNFNA